MTANNQITGAAPLGAVGLDWQLGGFASDPPTASMGSSDDQPVERSTGGSDGEFGRRQRRSRRVLASTPRLPVAYSFISRRRSRRRPMNHPTMNTAQRKATITFQCPPSSRQQVVCVQP